MNEMNEAAVAEEQAREMLPAALQEMIRKAVAQAVAEEKKAFQPTISPADELKEREAALAEREQALIQREMRAFAREQLALRQLPDVLIGALCCKDEACCNESLDQVEKAFRTAVQEGVVERMRGQEPARGDAVSLDTMDDDAYYHFTYAK
ncbi:MAG: DUF4355 domain-containing protein [Clostridia bacterium]|nr:DUF4355 domain-containing protein [Clostridia bacterium]